VFDLALATKEAAKSFKVQHFLLLLDPPTAGRKVAPLN
jgi:hypothetical protein